MNLAVLTIFFLTLSPIMLGAADVDFSDPFRKTLQPGWTWVREDPASWRMTDQGLEIRVQPGNMWGGANNARNVLVRPLPEAWPGGLDIRVRVHNKPSEQYEQIDLVWYYDDSHMVKIGQEQVDGKWSVVMGREERDRTRTLAIIPMQEDTLDLRFQVRDRELQGAWKPVGELEWRHAGTCDLPAPEGGKPHLSLQAYQGPADKEHWARVSGLVVRPLGK